MPKLAWALCREFSYQDQLADSASLAFVVMPDHFHWLLQLSGNKSLQQIVNSLKGRSARKINTIQRGRGRVWQGGYHDRAIRRFEDIEVAANYLIENPVRAGLVSDRRDYPYWGSVWHAHKFGPEGPPTVSSFRA